MGTDINQVQIAGRIATEPELKVFDSGARLIRYLITTRTEDPRHVDVIPVTYWDPTDEAVDNIGDRNDVISVSGSIQRRFWESPDGRRSRLEVVASSVVVTAAVEVAV